MRLKSLKLHGFKSFANKTEFEFHPGVTGIVGPNGCGKSNVVDAIRWVLGETSAKALRGGEMADVIFNGTDKRKPVGMAEVTLTMADCEETLGVDYNEVALTRRVFRDGKSEYRLNGTLCRLRDFHELLMDTGIGRTAYSIMEQGKIDMLLSSKPEDRRTVFEEAAGITKFKSQKKEALRKLEYTEANLLRITDIIEEVKRQINSLNRQANKARRYQELLGDVSVLDTHYSYRQFVELDAEKGELSTSILSLAKGIAESAAGIDEKEHGIVAARDALAELEAEIASRREGLIETQNRMAAATSRIEFNEERHTEFEGLMGQNAEDVEKTRSTLGKEQSDLEATAEALQRIGENIANQRQRLGEHETATAELRTRRAALEQESRELTQKSTAAAAKLAELRAEIGSSARQVDGDRERAAYLVGEIAGLDKEHAERLAEFERLGHEITTASTTLSDGESRAVLAEKDYQEARNNRDRLGRELADLHRELAEKESRLKVLKGMVADGEGLEKGTQAVLGGLDPNDPHRTSVRGMLSSFIEVDPDYIPAIEAALGNHLQTILVRDAGAAELAISTLTDGRLGRASIIPEHFVPAAADRQMMTLPTGVEAWALDKIKAADNVRPLLEKLLERTLVVVDVAAALRLRDELGGYSFATLDGNFISPEGVLEGGAGAADEASSLLARLNEIRELETTTSGLNDRLGERQLELEQIEQRVDELSRRVDECREHLQAAKVSHSTLEGKRSLLEREREGLDSKLENVRWEKGELGRRQQGVEERLSALREEEKTVATENDAGSQRQSQVVSSLTEAERQESESADLLGELRTSMAVEERSQHTLQEQKAPIAARMNELEAAIVRRESEIASYRERIEGADSENDSLREEITSLTTQAETLGTALGDITEQRHQRQAGVDKAESSLRTARREVASLTEQSGKEEIKVTQIELRIESITSTVQQRYNIELEHFEPDSHALLAAIEDQKKAHSRREKRRSTIETKRGEDEGDSFPVEIEAEIQPQSEETEVPTEQVSEDQAMEAAVAAALGETGPDWDFVERVIGELKQRLDSMGPVNLDAIEEFEALQERYDFLTKEHDDLVNSKDLLHKVIVKINRETRTLFTETFEKVRENFKGVFKELFGEQGKANLILLDESDPLESGIEIMAKPPGKKPQSITLLSGGERSMTAVALLFSIYMVKPSPFCVLDELDAPLDESNIARFLKMLERFTEQSQFVIVTHNKRTMNRCDVMYGVTQEDFGVSKLIGMKMTGNEDTKPKKAEAEVEAKTEA